MTKFSDVESRKVINNFKQSSRKCADRVWSPNQSVVTAVGDTELAVSGFREQS